VERLIEKEEKEAMITEIRKLRHSLKLRNKKIKELEKLVKVYHIQKGNRKTERRVVCASRSESGRSLPFTQAELDRHRND